MAVQQEEANIRNEAAKLNELDQLMRAAEVKGENLVTIREISKIATSLSAVSLGHIIGLNWLTDIKYSRPEKIILVVSGLVLASAIVAWVDSSAEIRMTKTEYDSYSKRREAVVRVLDTRAKALAALKEKLGVNTQNIINN